MKGAERPRLASLRIVRAKARRSGGHCARVVRYLRGRDDVAMSDQPGYDPVALWPPSGEATVLQDAGGVGGGFVFAINDAGQSSAVEGVLLCGGFGQLPREHPLFRT